MGFVVIEESPVDSAGETLKLEEGCEEDRGRFAGFGSGCEGLKKSRIDLFPDIIYFKQELVFGF